LSTERITKAKMIKAMDSELKQLFQPARYDDVIIVEEGYTFTKEINLCSDIDLSSDRERQGDGILDILKKTRTKQTTLAVSREQAMSDSQSEKPTRIVIGLGKPEKYLLDCKKSAPMLNEILNLLDENSHIKAEELKSFVKKYGYLRNPAQVPFYKKTGSDITESFMKVGYDSLDAWQLFVQKITETIRLWENPLSDIYNPYTGEKDYSNKFRDIIIQVNECVLQRGFIYPRSDSGLQEKTSKRILSNKIFLAQMLQEGIRNADFEESFYVLTPSGQLFPHRTPGDLYSFMWLWIEQAILNDKAPNSLRKCIYCNEYGMAMELNRSHKRDLISKEHLWYHDVCYRRHMKRKTIEEKAKSEGRTLHIRPNARKEGVS
jgi:hypothetical protein